MLMDADMALDDFYVCHNKLYSLIQKPLERQVSDEKLFGECWWMMLHCNMFPTHLRKVACIFIEWCTYTHTRNVVNSDGNNEKKYSPPACLSGYIFWSMTSVMKGGRAIAPNSTPFCTRSHCARALMATLYIYITISSITARKLSRV